DLSFNEEGEQICQNDVDVVLVMDRSGSMDEGTCYYSDGSTVENVTEGWCYWSGGSSYILNDPTRLMQSKEAAISFLGNLNALNDQSALVSYASTAFLDKELSIIHLDSNGSPSTETAVNALVAVGATNIGEAIEKATAELTSSGRTEATKNMILLTDGIANKPNGNGYDENPLDVAYAESEAAIAKALGYKIFTIGLGTGVNEDMLRNIASTVDDYYPAVDSDDLDNIYEQISQELCQ
ncbi:VWA domain-containing protein, partial [Candidatus Parcubacteria bacterium]|nr:VWA domain-containing protein [Candidatus Parcubacteria bacterium]